MLHTVFFKFIERFKTEFAAYFFVYQEQIENLTYNFAKFKNKLKNDDKNNVQSSSNVIDAKNTSKSQATLNSVIYISFQVFSTSIGIERTERTKTSSQF